MSHELTLDSRLRPSPDCAYQMVGVQAIAIVPARRRQHFFANEVAVEILRGIESEKSLRQIRNGILDAYEASAEVVEKDLMAVCRKLIAEGVAEPVPGNPESPAPNPKHP